MRLIPLYVGMLHSIKHKSFSTNHNLTSDRCVYRWEHYDNKYLKKWLLRDKVMTKEHGIMRVHSKLSLKDAMQSVHSGFSVHQAQNGQSLLRLIKNWSVTSFQDQ